MRLILGMTNLDYTKVTNFLDQNFVPQRTENRQTRTVVEEVGLEEIARVRMRAERNNQSVGFTHQPQSIREMERTILGGNSQRITFRLTTD